MKKIILILFVLLFYSPNYGQSSFSYLEKAANNGDIDAQKFLAEGYLQGNHGFEKNKEKAHKWFLRAAEQDDVDSQVVLATNRDLALLVDKSEKNREYWLEKAALNGNPSAIDQYATILFKRKDPKAFSFFSSMANEEYGQQVVYEGKMFLGDCYYEGLGVRKNESKAASLWKEVWGLGVYLDEKNNEKSGLINSLSKRYISLAGKRIGDYNLNGGYIDDALSYYKDAYEANPINTNIVLPNYAWALFLHENKINKAKEMDEAFSFFQLAASSTDNEIAYQGNNGIALMLTYSSNPEALVPEGLKYVSKALSLAETDEQNINIMATKGLLYLKGNDLPSAIEVWSTMQKLNSTITVDFIQEKSSSRLYVPLHLFVNEMKKMVDGNVDLDIYNSSGRSLSTFVVIISNENYKRVEPVPFANNDGKIFKEYCIKTLGIPESNIQFVEDATYNDIKYTVNWLSNIIEAYSGKAKIIFYYAGHGIPDEKQSTAYLLPIDGYSNDVTTGYKMDDLYTSLGAMPSESVMVFLDACFSGTKREGDMMASARGVAIKVKKATPSGNMVVLSAAQGDETAYPYSEQKHGMFTYYLLRKLQETKGEASLGEISDYVISEVKKNSIVKNGKMQTPTVVVSGQIGENWKNWTLK